MARFLSTVYSMIRGSVGGLTYFSGPYHQLQVRQRTAPVQPNSNAQTWARAAFSAAVVAWQNLSKANKDLWEAYAATCTREGPLGPYQPSGRMLAIGQYMQTDYVVSLGLAAFPGGSSMTPPALTGVPAITDPNYTICVGAGIGFRLNWHNMNAEAMKLIGTISEKQTASTFFYKGPFLPDRTFHVETAAAAPGFKDITSLEDGGIYFAKMRLVTTQNVGRRFSEASIIRCIAAPCAP